MDYSKDALLIEDFIMKHNQSHQDLEPPSTEEINFINSSIDPDFNDTSLGYIPYSMRPETYIVPCLFAIIFVIGVMGNGTLIGIFIKHRTMRNVPNMYIVSLAVGDLFVILFCVPFTSTVYTVESWPYGEFVCKFSEFIKDLSIGVSVFTLTALSADRYFAIVDPMRKLHGRRATRITCITITGIWVLSVVMALPSGLFSYVRAIDNEPSRIFYVCYPFPPELEDYYYPQIMVMFHFLVYYAIPLAFISTFYIIMARHLVLSTKNMPGEAQGGQVKQIQARKKVAKMILSFVVIFAICFFPSHLFLLWFYFYPESEYHFNEFWNICRISGFCLSFINSCINPITLYCVSGTFRKQFNEHLFCCICEANGRNRPRRRVGFGCGCVSLSSAGPHPFGTDYRTRNGYAQGRGLCRGSTTNSANGLNSTTKRKSTWDTQSTLSHPYNLTVHSNNYPMNMHPNGVGDTTPTNPSLAKHSRNPSPNTFPLAHHPYQKDYQEYMDRINELENGDLPPPPQPPPEGGGVGNVTKTKLAMTKMVNSDSIPEYTMTSFINLRGSGGSTTTNTTNDATEGTEIFPLMGEKPEEEKVGAA